MFTEFEDEVSLPKNDVQGLASDSYRTSPTFLIFHSPKVGVPPPSICILFMLGGTSNNTTPDKLPPTPFVQPPSRCFYQ